MSSLTALDGWLIALVAVLVYAVVVYILYRRKILGADRTLSLFGPALMIKTTRGRAMLDRIGRFRRLWSGLGDLGILLAAAAMVVIVAVLILDAILSFQLTAAQAPSPQEALGLPGINPIIPIGYGIVALVVGVVLHELCHGIVARSQKIGVKSLGILWFVVPVGAFVEQDDQDMTAAPRRRRDRVAAAGVLANFGLAVLFSLALAALIASSVAPNAVGVGVASVLPNTPAANASLQPGDIITAVNSTPTTTNAELLDYLVGVPPGTTITFTYWDLADRSYVVRPITLTSLSSYTHDPADAKKGFLGVSVTFITPAQTKQVLVSPLSSPSGPVIGFTQWLVLPLATMEPVSGTTMSFFHLTGPFSGGDPGTFWIVANLLYWLAWIDLLLGLSNALPLIPLDGGLLFRDFAASIAHRLRSSWSAEKLDAFGGRAAAVSSVVILVLLAWQFVVPRLI